MSNKKTDSDEKKPSSFEEKIESQLRALSKRQEKILKKLRDQEEETNMVVETQNELLQHLSLQLREMHDKLGQLSDRNGALLRKIRKLRNRR